MIIKDVFNELLKPGMMKAVGYTDKEIEERRKSEECPGCGAAEYTEQKVCTYCGRMERI